jgi:hypothetical protein
VPVVHRAGREAAVVNRPDDAHRQPDGPTPAREQLPLPRRRNQSHLEPQLRTPGSAGTGTPFTPFNAEITEELPVVRAGRAEAPATASADRAADRAAAFHAGARRGRGVPRPRRRGPGPHRADR